MVSPAFFQSSNTWNRPIANISVKPHPELASSGKATNDFGAEPGPLHHGGLEDAEKRSDASIVGDIVAV